MSKTFLYLAGGALAGAAAYLGYNYWQQSQAPAPVAPTAGSPALTPGYQDYRGGERAVPVGVDAPLTPAEQEIIDTYTLPSEEN